jgi:hypothetical protein
MADVALTDLASVIIAVVAGVLSAALVAMGAKFGWRRASKNQQTKLDPPTSDEAVEVARAEVDRQAEVAQAEVKEVLESGDGNALADMINKRER